VWRFAVQAYGRLQEGHCDLYSVIFELNNIIRKKILIGDLIVEVILFHICR